MTSKLSGEILALLDEIQAMKDPTLSRDDMSIIAQFKATVGPHMYGMARDRSAVCIAACRAMAANGLSILSIGSGLGLFEGFLVSIGIPVVCIDPDPYSFNRTTPGGPAARFITMPNYKTVDDYCGAAAPQTVNLLINWPWPDDDKREPYDYDAIVRLKPAEFVVMYGPCGASGSEELIKALTGRDGMATLFGGPAASLPTCTFEDVRYKLMSTDDKVYGTGYGFVGKTVRCARYARA